MFDLKPLSKDAIPAALAKAERYRLLNESEMAESICEDILAADPDNRQAIVTMILAVTDQFRGEGVADRTARARALVARLPDEYERLYYAGIVNERRGRAHLARGVPGSADLCQHPSADDAGPSRSREAGASGDAGRVGEAEAPAERRDETVTAET